MALVIAGIDEAGYGPTLGPLVVGMAAFRIAEWSSERTVPNMWKMLESGVSREPGRGGRPDAKGRIAVADSKSLKLANSVQSTHPLVHLERGVLAFLNCHRIEPDPGDDAMTPDAPTDAARESCRTITDDARLFSRLACALPRHDCYRGEATPLPIANSDHSLAIAGNILGRSLSAANTEIVALRCRVVSETDVNRAFREHGSKADANSAAFGDHIRHVWDRFAPTHEKDRLVIVCDRLGGRDSYAPMLAKQLQGAAVTVIEQTEEKSRYTVSTRERRADVAFMTGGESLHLPIALASMAAKFVRELAMMRFNRYWSRVHAEIRGDGLRPTAGYAQDARRWLADAAGLLSEIDRERLVRIA